MSFLSKIHYMRLIAGASMALYQSLLILLDCGQWQDVRHLKGAANIIVGQLLSESVNLTKWIPFANTRAKIAQSVQRYFIRWLNNDNIKARELYAPLITSALADWGMHKLHLALDTSMLRNKFCIIRISAVYRGRAIPLVRKVIEHGSASVAYEDYEELLTQSVNLLPLMAKKVILLADRGFVHIKLMKKCKLSGRGFRIRCKKDVIVHREGCRTCKTGGLAQKKTIRCCFCIMLR